MLVDDLKKRIATAVKDGDHVGRDVLRLALGEVQTAEARKNTALSDEDSAAILRKLIKSNEETLALAGTGKDADVLRHEIALLGSLLPATLSVDAIVELLAAEREAIRAAKADGQATGVAMKTIKARGVAVSGNDVAAAVKKIRS